MSNKFYTAKKVINGTEYTAQFNGLSAALQAVDNSYIEGTSNTSTLKLAEYILENVIVEPKNLTVDDFADLDEFNQVIRFGSDVMHGKFRNKADESTDKGKGKK